MFIWVQIKLGFNLAISDSGLNVRLICNFAHYTLQFPFLSATNHPASADYMNMYSKAKA